LSVRYMLSPSADFHYFGEPWLWIWRPGELEFIQKASWYKGISPEKVRNVPGVTFAQGSYWGIRTDVLRAIDWPDPRLSHNGGDTKLGEAVRQNGYKFKAYSYGVKTNDSARRGLSEQPAGSI
jgi:GT2 family glycosyltransferase